MNNGTILKQRYKILRHIGSGGMAEVYLAEDLLLNRQVAIKILRDQFNDDKTLLNQFKHEAQSAARLSSPSIINIFDVCEEEGKSFIVMEYVEGKTLKDLLEEKGRLSPYKAVCIAEDIAAGLSHAHRRNIIHCDIKPHNILITENMHPKIADFVRAGIGDQPAPQFRLMLGDEPEHFRRGRGIARQQRGESERRRGRSRPR